jgi:chromosomal replication initiation ATPase DnaA
MTDLVSNIQSEMNANEDDEEDNADKESESTEPSEIEDFNNWARNQASKDLSNFKHLTDLCDMNKLRSNISTLNAQQRRLFDDFAERMVSTDVNEKPCYLFLAGEAGTGKSHLVQLLIEAVKIIKLKAGAELKKTSCNCHGTHC